MTHELRARSHSVFDGCVGQVRDVKNHTAAIRSWLVVVSAFYTLTVVRTTSFQLLGGQLGAKNGLYRSVGLVKADIV
jgi:hypothetical protein